jgi:hypothetical protein
MTRLLISVRMKDCKSSLSKVQGHANDWTGRKWTGFSPSRVLRSSNWEQTSVNDDDDDFSHYYSQSVLVRASNGTADFWRQIERREEWGNLRWVMRVLGKRGEGKCCCWKCQFNSNIWLLLERIFVGIEGRAVIYIPIFHSTITPSKPSFTAA